MKHEEIIEKVAEIVKVAYEYNYDSEVEFNEPFGKDDEYQAEGKVFVYSHTERDDSVGFRALIVDDIVIDSLKVYVYDEEENRTAVYINEEFLKDEILRLL